MPWIIDVVEFWTVSQSELQDVALSSLSRRLASRQTVRVVVTFPVHIQRRHMDAAFVHVRVVPRRERQVATEFIRATWIHWRECVDERVCTGRR